MSTDVRRPLSPSERWYWIADQVSPLNVLARVHVYGEFASGLLERAAAALASEHPLLRVAINADPDGTRPRFVPSAGMCDVRRVHGDAHEWERQVDAQELARSVAWRTGPLFRILDVTLDSVAHQHDVVLTVSHIIADGTTALTLLQRLLEHADRLAADDNSDDGVVSRGAVAAPDDLLPAPYQGMPGAARVVVTGLADLLGGALGARPRRLMPEIAVPPALRRTRLIRCTLSAGQLDILARRCRDEGVTVHGALAAAMAMAIGPSVAEQNSGRICIGSPVDLRSDLVPAVSTDEAGAYVCTVPSIVRFGIGHDLWSTARQINRTLARANGIGQPLALLAALRFMSPVSRAKSAKAFGLLERFGPGNVCISNLGRYDFAERIGPWRLSGAQFCSGVSVSGYLAATVNTSHGQLFWNFNHIDIAVSGPSAQQFADGSVRILLDAIAAPEDPVRINEEGAQWVP